MSVTATVGGVGLSDHNLPFTTDASAVLAPKVTIRLMDSSCCWSSGASQADAVRAATVSAWPDARLSLYVDDTAEFINNDTAKLEPAERWVAAGYEFGTDGYSGDPFSVTAPIEFTYTGGETNPQLTISNSGKLWTFFTDEGDDDLAIDTTKGELLDTYQVDKTGIGFDSGIHGYLDATKLGVWSLDTVGGASGYDDAFCLVFADDTYAASENISYDNTRRWNEELNVSISDILLIDGLTSVETFLYRFSTESEPFITAAQAYGLKVTGAAISPTFQGIPLNETISDWFRIDLTMDRTTIDNWGAVEATIRAKVNETLRTNSERWLIMECPIIGATFGTNQIIWMIDEFADRGCEMVTTLQAYNSLK